MSKFQATKDYLNAVAADIQSQLSSRGMTTTGTAAGSLQVVQARSRKTGRFEARFYLISIDYLPLLYTGVGVKPDKFPPFQPGSELYKWVVNKGITFTKNNGSLMTRRQTSRIMRVLRLAGWRSSSFRLARVIIFLPFSWFHTKHSCKSS
jgi:hypothetical protein